MWNTQVQKLLSVLIWKVVVSNLCRLYQPVAACPMHYLTLTRAPRTALTNGFSIPNRPSLPWSYPVPTLKLMRSPGGNTPVLRSRGKVYRTTDTPLRAV